MKRTPLQRRAQLARKTRLAARRAAPRRSSRVYDAARRAWTRRQPCCARQLAGHRCDGRVVGHHTGWHGTSQKPDDALLVAICQLGHQHVHAFAGVFRGWVRADMESWEAAEVADHQARYQRHVERLLGA